MGRALFFFSVGPTAPFSRARLILFVSRVGKEAFFSGLLVRCRARVGKEMHHSILSRDGQIEALCALAIEDPGCRICNVPASVRIGLDC